jgi:hypothetical protein
MLLEIELGDPKMKKSSFLIAAAIASSLLPAQADAPSHPTACNAVVGEGAARAVEWLEDRVAALQQLENPTEQDAVLLKGFETNLRDLKGEQLSGEDNDEARCTPAVTFDNSDKIS